MEKVSGVVGLARASDGALDVEPAGSGPLAGAVARIPTVGEAPLAGTVARASAAGGEIGTGGGDSITGVFSSGGGIRIGGGDLMTGVSSSHHCDSRGVSRRIRSTDDVSTRFRGNGATPAGVIRGRSSRLPHMPQKRLMSGFS
jgi:hypothetical protein